MSKFNKINLKYLGRGDTFVLNWIKRAEYSYPQLHLIKSNYENQENYGEGFYHLTWKEFYVYLAERTNYEQV